MGLNICVYRLPEAREVPASQWDWARHGGDSVFTSLFNDVRMEETINKYGDVYIRPVDFDCLRIEMRKHETLQDRHFQLVDMLQKDPSLWIYVSY